MFARRLLASRFPRQLRARLQPIPTTQRIAPSASTSTSLRWQSSSSPSASTSTSADVSSTAADFLPSVIGIGGGRRRSGSGGEGTRKPASSTTTTTSSSSPFSPRDHSASPSTLSPSASPSSPRADGAASDGAVEAAAVEAASVEATSSVEATVVEEEVISASNSALHPSQSSPPPSTTTSTTTSQAVPEQSPSASTLDPADDPTKFRSLKGAISHDTYKALTERPFRFDTMSAVQQEVLNLLPELAAPQARGTPAAAVLGEGEVSGSSERGHRTFPTDLLVKAKTGTGKTVAFLTPAIEARIQDLKQAERDFKESNPSADKLAVGRYMAEYSRRSVGTVILSPTRELASQIANEAIRLMSHHRDWSVRLFIGGASRMRQLSDFRSRHNRRDIVVATPGRLKDLLTEPEVLEAVSKAKMLVFDEADTLLEMGFKDEIARIVEQLPPKSERQTFMFSATVSQDIRRIAKQYLKPQSTFIDCVPANENNTHVHVPQYQTVVDDPAEQIPHVVRLLAQDALLHPNGGKAVVFLPTTKATEMFAMILNAMRSAMPHGLRGTKVFEMHAKKTQSARDRVAQDFRAATGPGYRILVTSDVSARGVDYPGVTRVVQVGIPTSKDMYVHRVGRTGRAGKEGRGDIVLLPWETDYLAYQLQDMPLRATSTEQIKDEFEKLADEMDANPPPAPAEAAAESSSSSSNDRRSPRTGAFGGPGRNRDDRFGGRSRFDVSSPPAPITVTTPYAPTAKGIAERIKEHILPQLQEFDIKETFGSQLGFYTGHAHELRTSKYEVMQGLQQWAQQALGLPEPVHVSSSMMAKLGINEGMRSGRRPDRRLGEMDRKRNGMVYMDRERGFRDRRDRDSGSGSGRGGRDDYRSGGARGGDRYDRPAKRFFGGDPPFGGPRGRSSTSSYGRQSDNMSGSSRFSRDRTGDGGRDSSRSKTSNDFSTDLPF